MYTTFYKAHLPQRQNLCCFKMLQFSPSTHDSLDTFLCESGLLTLFNNMPSDIRD
jgi:hypothetical protein